MNILNFPPARKGAGAEPRSTLDEMNDSEVLARAAEAPYRELLGQIQIVEWLIAVAMVGVIWALISMALSLEAVSK